MEEQLNPIVSSPTPARAAEELILRADLVRETVARAARRRRQTDRARSGTAGGATSESRVASLATWRKPHTRALSVAGGCNWQP
jgi:hypothetical protein